MTHEVKTMFEQGINNQLKGVQTVEEFLKTPHQRDHDTMMVIGKGELAWLRFFMHEADFGPAHEDVVDIIKDDFVRTTGLTVPNDY